jgi:hypothetical protein
MRSGPGGEPRRPDDVPTGPPLAQATRDAVSLPRRVRRISWSSTRPIVAFGVDGRRTLLPPPLVRRLAIVVRRRIASHRGTLSAAPLPPPPTPPPTLHKQIPPQIGIGPRQTVRERGRIGSDRIGAGDLVNVDRQAPGRRRSRGHRGSVCRRPATMYHSAEELAPLLQIHDAHRSLRDR